MAEQSEREKIEWFKQRKAQVKDAAAAARIGRQAWVDSVRTGENVQARQPSDLQALGASVQRQQSLPTARNPAAALFDDAKDAFQKFQDGPPIRAPSVAESFIPVVGPAWEAASDLQQGHYGAAAFNGALAALDSFLGGEIAKGVAKGGVYTVKEGSYAWKPIRSWMEEKRFVKSGEHGHHWFIPQNGWGKGVPEWLKNQPWNIKPLDRVTHGRVHHSWKGLPRFNPAQRYWYGTPNWSKVGTAAAVGHPAAAADAQWDQAR